MKLCGIIIISGICIYAGFGASVKLKNRMIILRQLKMMLETSLIMIRYCASEISDLIAKFTGCDTYDRLLFLPVLDRLMKNEVERGEMSFSDAWDKSAELLLPMIKHEDMEIICRIGSTLGTTDIQGQIAALKQFISETEHQIVLADKEYISKGRLYRSLGIIAGAAAALAAA